MQARKREGRPLPDTEDMKIWREEFGEMSEEQHDRILKNLGLDDEDIEEFNENLTGKKSVEETLGLGEGVQVDEDAGTKKAKKN